MPLEELEAERFGFVVRLPDTDTDYDDAELFIQTFYSLLPTNTRVNFRRSPPITNISLNTGQRGTRVVITGERLLGFGEGTVELNQVLIGSSYAEIDSNNLTHISARVASGVPGSNAILVNTTQTISGNRYNGPYTSSNSLWTQLEDGVVSEIIPPAAQTNGTVRICGERLLGGGVSIDSITLADQQVETFGEVVAEGGSLECIEVRVPNISSPEDVPPGGVRIESDTGAIVESFSNVSFTYAIITDITPSQGQVGTEVTISGIGLLSGYPDLSPTVSLAGTEATVLSNSSERIVVRVQDPETTGSGELNLFNIAGDTVVTVTRDGAELSVSLADSWQYLEPGTIEAVQPVFGQFGTRITLTGTNLLGYGSSLREVRIDGSPAEIMSESNSEVVINAPDIETIGFVNITLEANNGALVSLEGAFEYRPRGVITDLNPPSGQNGTFGESITKLPTHITTQL